MEKKENFTRWIFVIFPAITMLLGWGLRGYIGGGPFGAMIPGAMVALSISMLLELPVAVTAIFAIFSVVGIGLGGEMTYGQTIGFVRNADTMWWGILGLTVKGGIWGLLGGILLAVGLIYHRLAKKTVIISLLLLLAGMLIGFKLINQPMIIYFSDPAKPRPESWGALLVGAILLLIYLKNKVEQAGYKIITRFARWGLIGGGLGFGLGGFWIALGSYLPKEVVFKEWWKAMEFTFGLLLGAAYGYAAWLSRKEIDFEKGITSEVPASTPFIYLKEFVITLILGAAIFWFFAAWLDPVVDAARGVHGFTMIGLADIAKMLTNYAFFGLIMVVVVMRYPFMAWQIAITLTFSHTVIDLVDDIYPNTTSLFSVSFALVFLLTLAVGLIAGSIQRHKNQVYKLFLLLVWSTVAVAWWRFAYKTDILNFTGLSFSQALLERFFVHIVFTASAFYCSWISCKRVKEINRDKEIIVN
jgi:hypothetical protein